MYLLHIDKKVVFQLFFKAVVLFCLAGLHACRLKLVEAECKELIPVEFKRMTLVFDHNQFPDQGDDDQPPTVSFQIGRQSYYEQVVINRDSLIKIDFSKYKILGGIASLPGCGELVSEEVFKKCKKSI